MSAPLDLERTVAEWLRTPRAKGGVVGILNDAVGLGTRAGRVKEANEDRLLCAHLVDREGADAILLLVCDGMGGMLAGARCAEIGIAAFVLSLSKALGQGAPPPLALHHAAQHANERVWREHHAEGGTTLSALILFRDSVWACTVGDSRLFGQGPGGLRQLSRDDTIEGAIASTKATYVVGNARRDPERQRLVQFIGMGESLEEHVFRIEPNAYRFLFICSDGVYEPAGPLLARIAEQASTPKQLAERLCGLAEWLGGADDASAAVVDLRPLAKGLVEREEASRVLQIWGPAPGSSGGLMFAETAGPARSAPPTAVQKSLSVAPTSPTPASSEIKKEKKKPAKKARKTKAKQKSLPLGGGGDLIIEVEDSSEDEEPPDFDPEEADAYAPQIHSEDGRRRSYR